MIATGSDNMNYKTEFNYIGDDWKRVKNHCRTTDNKDFTDKDATETFKTKLLISEHTPIRCLEYDWSWKGIPYWVSMEWARHKHEKFISTQRDDRLIDDIPRGKKPQEALVNHDAYGNQQNLIDAFRKRLCVGCVTPQAYKLAVDFKLALDATGHKQEALVLVPNCVYRCGCPEFKPCGFFAKFKIMCQEQNVNIFDIEQRYLAYDKWLKTVNGESK